MTTNVYYIVVLDPAVSAEAILICRESATDLALDNRTILDHLSVNDVRVKKIAESFGE